MSVRLKWMLYTLMCLALGFGFLHQFVPADVKLQFDRLHIFLFNLCSGGTILVYHTEQKKNLSPKGIAFCALAVTYALLAFFEWYGPAVACAWALSLLVESVRCKRFGFFPRDFFDSRVRVTHKFHQASLLCLSIGLFFSGLVILNNTFYHWADLPALQLRSFFLGFSFPLSLITMSVMFSLIKDQFTPTIKVLKNIAFWVVNLGVILFFVFIIFQRFGWQLFVSSVLTCCVIMIFILYTRLGIREQQKNFLTSGMCFLLFTAVTGMLYIFLHMQGDYDREQSLLVLRLHAFASLYGWNLSGLAVLIRYFDFPIRLHSRRLIIVHWLTVAILAPLGYYYRPFAVVALVCYAWVLYNMLFSHPSTGPYSQAFDAQPG